MSAKRNGRKIRSARKAFKRAQALFTVQLGVMGAMFASQVELIRAARFVKGGATLQEKIGEVQECERVCINILDKAKTDAIKADLKNNLKMEEIIRCRR